MLKLKYNEYKKVLPLISDIEHNIPIVFSVVEGSSPGEVYVDDIDAPKTVFLYPENSFFYIAGDETNEEFNSSLYTLIFDEILGKSNEAELILFPLSQGWKSKLSELLKDKGAITIKRKIFDFDEDKFKTNKIDTNSKLPAGYVLKPIDREIAKEIDVTKSWQSIDEFLDKGLGYCVMKDNELLSACYSIYIGNGEAEVDIFTKEEYMGQGLAKITASSFIEGCLSEGLVPSWACWPFRQASWNLAKKLGYNEMEDIQAYFWSPNM